MPVERRVRQDSRILVDEDDPHDLGGDEHDLENLEDHGDLNSLYPTSPRLRATSWTELDETGRYCSGGGEDILDKIASFLPILTWLRRYDFSQSIQADLFTGLTLGIVLIPQGMAYALLAELDPAYGLYSAIFPALLYMLTGTSNHVSMGPTALISLLTAEGASRIVPVDDEQYPAVASALMFVVGLILLILSVFRAGAVIVAFLADPVLSGFTSGAAVLIGSSQVKHLFGLDIPRGNLFETLYAIFSNLGQVKAVEVLMGIGSILVLIGMSYINKKYRVNKIPIPGQLVLVVSATLITWAAGLDVNVVGEIPSGLPTPRVDFFKPQKYFAQLIESAIVTACIVYIITITVAKTFSRKFDYAIDPNQELFAVAVVNMLAPFFGCFPSGASMSRAAIAGTTGPKSPLYNMFSLLLIVVCLLWLTPLIYYLPKGALAAIVMFALRNLIDLKEAVVLYRLNRNDCVLWVITFGVTCAGGVVWGIGIAVGASLVWLLKKNVRPGVAVLGVLPGTTIYRNIRRFEDAQEIPGIRIFRFGASLHFANKDYFRNELERACRNPAAIIGATISSGLHQPTDTSGFPGVFPPPLELAEATVATAPTTQGGKQLDTVIIEASSINDIDASAVRTMCDIGREFKARNLKLLLANVKGPVRDLLSKSDFYTYVFDNDIFLSLHDAVIYCTRMTKNKEKIRANMDRYHRMVPGAMGGERKTQLKIAKTKEVMPNGELKEWRVVTRVLRGLDSKLSNPQSPASNAEDGTRIRRLQSLVISSQAEMDMVVNKQQQQQQEQDSKLQQQQQEQPEPANTGFNILRNDAETSSAMRRSLSTSEVKVTVHKED